MQQPSQEIEIIRFSLGQRLADLIKTGQASIELSGHFASGKKIDRSYLIQNLGPLLFLDLLPGDVVALDRSMSSKHPLKKFRKLTLNEFFVCDQCGQQIQIETNGVEWCVVNPCPIPDGIGPIELELNVPSGSFVFGSDFREQFRIMGGHNYNPNQLFARVGTSARYADVGLIFLFIGEFQDSEIFQCENNKFVVGSCGVGNRLPLVAEQLRILPEGIRWYSLVDHAEFIRRNKGQKPTKDEIVIPCRPGVYHISHHQHLLDSTYYLPKILTEITWIREADPVRDFLSDFQKLNYTAEQVVGDLLFKNPQFDVYRAADCLICGYADAHPNGWVCTVPDLTTNHAVIIPNLDKKYNWAKLGDTSTVVRAARISENRIFRESHFSLNSSFLGLSLNVLGCMIKHDVGNLDLVKRCFNRLIKGDLS